MKNDLFKKILALLLIMTLFLSMNGFNIYANEQNNDAASSTCEAKDLDDINELSDDEQTELNKLDDNNNLDTGFNGSASEERAMSATELGYEPNEILVVYESSVNDSKIEAAIDSLDGEVETVISGNNKDIAVVEISADTTVEEACNEYNALSNVTYAQPNYILSIESTIINDEYYKSNQWYLKSDNGSTSRGINATGAWELLSKSNHNKVRVGVIDTGCQIDHPDLTNIINKNLSKEIINVNNSGKSYKLQALTGDASGYEDKINKTKSPNNYKDSAGHGTHVCGLIAAESNNGIGIAGAASGYDNSIVDLVAIDGLEYGANGSTSYVIAALDYAQVIDCKVINMSIGLPLNQSDSASVSNNIALETKCNELYNNNITIVCASGNNGQSSKYYPACYDSTIAVMNTTQNGTISSTSNYGAWCDICAPGTGIYSTIDGSTYGSKRGTSMSAPLVTATAAMMLSINDTLSPDDVKWILTDSATSLSQAQNTIPVYRLYNPGLGVHLWTSSDSEVKNLTTNWGWNDEGISFYAYELSSKNGEYKLLNAGKSVTEALTYVKTDLSSSSDLIPVYRLYNAGLSQHLLTSNESEVSNLTAHWGWTADFNGNPIYYASQTSGQEVYRLYNPYLSEHLYTTDLSEYRRLPAYDWIQENISFYGALN